MNYREVEMLTAGSIVAVNPAHGERYIVDCVVTKVNGHGHITVKSPGGQEYKFDKRGDEYGRYKGSSYYNSIMDNDLAKSRLAAQAEQTRINLKVNAILEKVASCKSYYHGYKVSTEVKHELLKMIGEL